MGAGHVLAAALFLAPLGLASLSRPAEQLALGPSRHVATSASTLSSWRVTPTTLPKGVSDGYLFTVTCPAAGDCTAVGRAIVSSNYEPLVYDEKNGVWTSLVPTLPEGASASNGLSSVACESAGNCVASGAFDSSDDPLLAVESDGSWSFVTAPGPPSNPDITGYNIQSIGCSSSECYALGVYTEYTKTGPELKGFVDFGTGDGWSFSDVSGTEPYFSGNISCVTNGACFGVGQTETSETSQVEVPTVASGTGGDWGLQTVPQPANAGTYANLFHVSCATATACGAIGQYTDDDGVVDPLLELDVGGTWFPTEPFTSGSQPAPVTPSAVSCPVRNGCVVAGTASTGSTTVPVVEMQSKTSWTPVALPAPSASYWSPAGFSCVAGTASCVLQGEQGTWYAGSGSSWKAFSAPAGPAGDSNVYGEAVGCDPGGECVALGGGTATVKGETETAPVIWTSSSTPLSIDTTSLPDATVGTAYSTTLSASGGTAPYTWSVSSGSLPDGLHLDASSGQISGTPTQAGSWTLTVKVKDSATPPGEVSAALTLNVLPVVKSVSSSPGDENVPAEGGTTLTVTGLGFKGATGVAFSPPGGKAVTVGISANASDSTITVTTPDMTQQVDSTDGGHVKNSDLNVDVRVVVPTTSGGTVESAANPPADQLTFKIPEVTSVDPDAGPVDGGTEITLKGAFLEGTDQVTFEGPTGKIQLAAVKPSSDPALDQVTLTTPDLSALLPPDTTKPSKVPLGVSVGVPVEGTGCGKNSATCDHVFSGSATYYVFDLTVTDVSPTSTPVTKLPERIDVHGTGFVNGASATLEFRGAGGAEHEIDVSSSDVLYISDTEVIVVVPSSATDTLEEAMRAYDTADKPLTFQLYVVVTETLDKRKLSTAETPSSAITVNGPQISGLVAHWSTSRHTLSAKGGQTVVIEGVGFTGATHVQLQLVTSHTPLADNSGKKDFDVHCAAGHADTTCDFVLPKLTDAVHGTNVDVDVIIFVPMGGVNPVGSHPVKEDQFTIVPS